ncbi:MAG: protein TolQ [Deltaproteobacteria bacterium]|nr:MAG: protein TolQ [Deltaproteobacteria bacterium]
MILALVPAAWAASIGGRTGGGIVAMILGAGAVVKLVLLILVVLSIACWTVILMKYRLLRRATNESARFLALFWNSKNLANVYHESKNMQESYLAEVFRVGYLELGKLTKSSDRERSGNPNNVELQMAWIDNMERALRSAVNGEVQRLEKALSLLATTGNAAPFIGLFGTVWGIMVSFQGIGLKGSATLAVVAPGISEALVATAAGLAAAIPAVIAYNHFTNKVRHLETEMANFANDFLNIVKRDLMRRASR